MTNELINTIVSAVVGAVSGGIVNFLLEKRKEHKEEKKEKEKNKREIYENRPELEIVDYKNYIKRTGYGISKKCDIEIFLARINNVSTENDEISVQFNEEHFNENEWCCVIYTFKNMGKTDISCITPICVSKRDIILYDVTYARELMQYGAINYCIYYDKKVRVGDTFSMKVCYHKDCIMSGVFAAIMNMGMEDSNGRCWVQPLFVPDNKIYAPHKLSRKEYREEVRSDVAIECFKKPGLW